MVPEGPKIVIIGAGIAGITAAHKLYTTPGVKESFELCVVEGGQRIGGRINSREFGGDRIEMGATWIHGIGGNPVYEIAQKIGSLVSEHPWEFMDGWHEEISTMAETRAEGGVVVDPSILEPISSLFNKLMSFSQTKSENGDVGEVEKSSIGSFLKHGLEKYLGSKEENEGVKVCGNWSKKMLQEAIFAVFENRNRTNTGAGDLFNLDYNAESEYVSLPGDEITIPRGYISIIEALASVLPPGLIQFGKKVVKIEWQQQGHHFEGSENGSTHINKPVNLHFSDGSIMQADHVIVTVSLGVLKSVISQESGGLFSPSLPSQKKDAISRLGFGVVDKLFLEFSHQNHQENGQHPKLPFLRMVFHNSCSEFRHEKIPSWMRTASMYPIHANSSVSLSWFAGNEALELESLDDESIIDGVLSTLSSFIPNSDHPHEGSNGNAELSKSEFEIIKVLKSKWGSDPLFLGSYSYVAVGSSGDDFDTLAEPIPSSQECGSTSSCQPYQIMFAGEATHRTHYSTTHGAYFSGLREANRILQHYNLLVGYELDISKIK